MSNRSCEFCANNVFDEELDDYFCDVDMDEDEYIRFLTSNSKDCPYFRNGDEYAVVRKQN